jgi:hypothetical protein
MIRRSNVIRFFALALIAGVLVFSSSATAQEPKTKVRIANSAMSVTSLPLLAAREWNYFMSKA